MMVVPVIGFVFALVFLRRRYILDEEKLVEVSAALVAQTSSAPRTLNTGTGV